MYKTHPKDRVKKELSKLKPLKYNKFMWWRKYTSPNPPSQKRTSTFYDRIENGDYDFSHYFWQAQQVEIELNEKFLNAKDYQEYLDNSQLDKVRRKRLLEDFIKDENEKLETIKRNVCKVFDLTEEEYYTKVENFDGTLSEFWESLGKGIKKPFIQPPPKHILNGRY